MIICRALYAQGASPTPATGWKMGKPRVKPNVRNNPERALGCWTDIVAESAPRKLTKELGRADPLAKLPSKPPAKNLPRQTCKPHLRLRWPNQSPRPLCAEATSENPTIKHFARHRRARRVSGPSWPCPWRRPPPLPDCSPLEKMQGGRWAHRWMRKARPTSPSPWPSKSRLARLPRRWYPTPAEGAPRQTAPARTRRNPGPGMPPRMGL
mmetsp:Transcript_98896/g.251032  ORF Transcript_98896/g.251032 Transcript_98896/m.251032 type:complete len:210 (-) Transcript_98896:557-1186(-)